jgi:hypothetical protein
MQFKQIKKWVSHPFEGANYKPQKIAGINYGKWKPIDRWIEITIEANCKAPHYLFSIIEGRHQQTDDGETLEWFNDDRQVYSVAIYPEYTDQYYSTLFALVDDVRGETAERFINGAFIYYLATAENFMKANKSSFGYNIGDKNPIEVFFPNWWTWWKDQTRLWKKEADDRKKKEEEKEHATA